MARGSAVYEYHDTVIRAERLAAGRDHCGSAGPVYDITELLNDGRVIDPELRSNVTTTSSRRMIYAVDVDLNVHVAFDGERGRTNAVKHETLFHNAAVRAAGEIEFVDGVVSGINDQSGSYRTTGFMSSDPDFADAVLKALRRCGVAIRDSTLHYLTTLARL